MSGTPTGPHRPLETATQREILTRADTMRTRLSPAIQFEQLSQYGHRVSNGTGLRAATEYGTIRGEDSPGAR